MYSPILRNRQSEMLALRHLSGGARQGLMPILDIASPTKTVDQVKGQVYVARNISRTKKAVAGFVSVFVDSSEIDPTFRLEDGLHPLIGVANAVTDAGTRAIPVTGLHRDDAHRDAVRAIRTTQQEVGLCIRLDPTDIGTATLTNKGIQELLKSESIAPPLVYLLVDLQCVHGLGKEPSITQIERLFRLLSKERWGGIIVGGYGIPDQLSMFISTNEQGYLKRVEQDIFYGVAAYNIEAPIWFADYTILPPSVVELDWRLIRRVMTPKALYTLEDSWFIVRGGAFSRHPDGYDQYYSIAEEIVALDEYCGKNYSYGDKYIWDCAQRAGSAGSPASWITACVNHHIEFTVDTHST